MKNDWYNILGLEDSKSMSNVNIKVLLDEFFKKFIFRSFDKDGNIIVLYTKDKKEYKVIFDKKYDESYKKRTDLDMICDLSLILNVESNCEITYNKLVINANNLYDETGLDEAFNYNINLERKKNIYHDASSYFKVNESKLKYIKSLFVPHKEEAEVLTDVFYIDKLIQTQGLLPDTSCKTKITKGNDDNYNLNNYLYIQKTPIYNKENSFKSNLPITYLLIDDHKEFLEKHDYEDKDLKNNAGKTYKIGF